MVEVSKDGLSAEARIALEVAQGSGWKSTSDNYTRIYLAALAGAQRATATLQAERDRYRVALEEIAASDGIGRAADVARTALSDAPVQS